MGETLYDATKEEEKDQPQTNEEWEEISGEIVSFKKEGDEIVGKLVRIADGQFNNKVYTLKTKDGMKTVFGTKILEDRMSGVEIGETVKIVYKGEIPSDKYPNPPKNFSVFRKKSSE